MNKKLKIGSKVKWGKYIGTVYEDNVPVGLDIGFHARTEEGLRLDVSQKMIDLGGMELL